MTYAATRQKLIQAGSELIGRKGYHAVGLQEILDHVEVPKGSFYHYFKSKEDFGVQIIRHNIEAKAEFINRQLSDSSRSPLERLKNLYLVFRQKLKDPALSDQSVIGKLMSEIAELSEPMRLELQAGLRRWKASIQSCLQEAQRQKQISSEHRPAELADFIFNSWEGAILRARLEKSDQPLGLFYKYLFERLLG